MKWAASYLFAVHVDHPPCFPLSKFCCTGLDSINLKLMYITKHVHHNSLVPTHLLVGDSILKTISWQTCDTTVSETGVWSFPTGFECLETTEESIHPLLRLRWEWHPVGYISVAQSLVIEVVLLYVIIFCRIPVRNRKNIAPFGTKKTEEFMVCLFFLCVF